MASFDSTAFSTNAFSVNAFDFDSEAPPAPPAALVVRPSGGFPSGDRGPTKAQTRRSRILHGIEEEVIERVAVRQVQALDLDAIQQRQELEGELRLRGIEAQIAHYEELVRRRQAMIDAEIAERLHARLRQIMLDEEAALVILIAASI